jgi:hypothetical protein
VEKIISLRFKYAEEEYVSATRFYLTRAADFWFQLAAGALFVLAGLFLVLLTDLQPVIAFILTFVGVVWLFVWVLALFVMPGQRFRGEPKFKDEYFLQFSDDGIQFKTTQVDALIQWSLYRKVLENDKFYLLIYGKNMLSVIPRRAFAGANEEAAFKEMLGRNLPAHSYPERLKGRRAGETKTSYRPPTEPPDWR